MFWNTSPNERQGPFLHHTSMLAQVTHYGEKPRAHALHWTGAVGLLAVLIDHDVS